MTKVFVSVWRRYWPLNFMAVVFFVVVVLFASFLHHAQDRQRAGTCAILDRLPAHIDVGVDRARALYDCGKPTPPTLFFGHPFPKPTPTVKPHHVSPGPGTSTRTVVIVPGRTASPSGRSSTPHAVTHKPSPRPTSRPTPKPTPKPTPRPLPSICVPGVACVSQS